MYGPNRPMFALIALPSAVSPTRRGSLNISSACSRVTVSIRVPAGSGANCGLFSLSSVSPSWSIGPNRPNLAKIGLPLFGSVPTSLFAPTLERSMPPDLTISS